MASRNARLGLILFAVYLLLYGGFVGINAFAPDAMEATPIAGVNLAILYGFVLGAHGRGLLSPPLYHGPVCFDALRRSEASVR